MLCTLDVICSQRGQVASLALYSTSTVIISCVSSSCITRTSVLRHNSCYRDGLTVVLLDADGWRSARVQRYSTVSLICRRSVTEFGSGYPFLSSAWTRTTVASSSTSTCIATASGRGSPSPALAPTRRVLSEAKDSCHVEQKNWSVVRRLVGYLDQSGLQFPSCSGATEYGLWLSASIC